MLGPYRSPARAQPGREGSPESVRLGLLLATCGFGAGALAWLVAHAITPSGAKTVPSLYAVTLDAALVGAAALCAWRPVPRTRSHVFARLALVGGLVAVFAERWPSHTTVNFDPFGQVLDQVTDPPGLLLASSAGRLLQVVALAGVALATGRRFGLPRWAPVVAAGVGASLIEPALAEVLRAPRAACLHPTYTMALAELVMLVAFGVAFGAAALAVRRPFLDAEDALAALPPRMPSRASDRVAFGSWQASLDAVLACTFTLASLVGEGLRRVASTSDERPSRSVARACAMVITVVLVERARRRCAGESSFALTLGAAVAAVCGVVSVFAATDAFVFRDVGLATTAMTLGGIAHLLPDLPVAARAVTKVKGLLYTGVAFVLLSVAADLSRPTICRLRPETTWFTGPVVSEVAALLFVALAVHRARRIEREALVAEALAARAAVDEVPSGQ